MGHAVGEAIVRGDYPGRGGRARRRSLRHPAALAAILGIAACGASADGTTRADDPASPESGRQGYVIERMPPERLRLTGAATSLEDLLRVVESSLSTSDTTRLSDLMISDAEFRAILFPAFPAAHPPISAPFETVWPMQFADSYRGLRRLLEVYGGKDVRILAVRFDQPDQDFVNFILHETSRVDVSVGGVRRDGIRLFGSVIRIGDQYKVLTYPDDPS